MNIAGGLRNWKTTLLGALTAAGAGMIGSDDPTVKSIGKILAILGPILLGFFSRDYNLTSEQSSAKESGSNLAGLKLFFLLLIPCLFLNACSTIAPGSDPVVVNAERVTGIAFDTFDVFLKTEYQNHDQLLKLNPEIHKAAELMRHRAPEWIASARSLTKAYKQNRTQENKASLITAVAVLQTGLSQAQHYITEAK